MKNDNLLTDDRVKRAIIEGFKGYLNLTDYELYFQLNEDERDNIDIPYDEDIDDAEYDRLLDLAAYDYVMKDEFWNERFKEYLNWIKQHFYEWLSKPIEED